MDKDSKVKVHPATTSCFWLHGVANNWGYMV